MSKNEIQTKTQIQDWPAVSVSILSFNREKELRITLNKTLFELDYPQDKLEIIVCDNASTDGTQDMLKKEFPSVIHIRMPENIGTPAWNQGFLKGCGKYFLILDDDAHMEGDALKKAIDFMEANPGVGILSFNVVDPQTRYSYTLHMPYGIFSFWGCNVVIRKELIDTIGGFDPNIFIYSHEPDFVIRAVKKGYRHHVMIDQIAFHRKDPSIYNEYSYFKCFNNNFSRHYTYIKHLHGGVYVKYILNALARTIMSTVLISHYNKRFERVMFESFFKAWRLGRQAKYSHVRSVEKIVYENDPRCMNIGHRIQSFFHKDLHAYLINFFRKRQSYFPDFIEKYFGRWVPFENSEAE